MIDGIFYLTTQWLHLSGFPARLFVALCLAVIISVSVIIIGTLVNWFELLQMRILSKFFKQKTVFVLCNYLTFPGVCIHELSHAGMAWLTGADVQKIELFKIDKTDQLGCVRFALRGSKFKQHIQLALTSCAPVMTGLLLSYILIRVLFLYSLPLYASIILWYILISIIDHMSMSSTDIRNYFSGILYLFPCMFIICWFFVYFFHR